MVDYVYLQTAHKNFILTFGNQKLFRLQNLLF